MHLASRPWLILFTLTIAIAPAQPAMTAEPLAQPDDGPVLTRLVGTPKMARGREISHGPMLGRPGESGIGVWARTNKPGEFFVFYGTDPERLTERSDAVQTRLEDDNAAWVMLEGLRPDTRYYYAVGFEDAWHQPELSGSFRTLPAARQYRNRDHNPEGLFNFAFAASGCARMNRRGSAGITPQRTMVENHADKVLFALHAGDFVYEEGRTTQVEEWLWRMGMDVREDAPPASVAAAPALVGAWENYKIYLERSNYLAEWHRLVPTYYVFDDHEIINNVYGAGTPGFADPLPKRLRNAVYRDIGLEAWDDYLAWANPVEDRLATRFGTASTEVGGFLLRDVRADFRDLDIERQGILHIHWGRPSDGDVAATDTALGPADPNAGVYGIEEVVDRHTLRLSHPTPAASAASAYSIGRENWASFRVGNVEFYLLDTRGNRDAPGETFDMSADASMLGERQKAWLMDSMRTSDADIFVLLSSVNLSIPHLHYSDELERYVGPDEAWTGYMQEREELLELWDELEQPVLMINADLHNAFSAQVTDNVWEFTASPINSDNQHRLGQEGDRPSNGLYRSGNRDVTIRWSTFSLPGSPRVNLRTPVYVVVNVNNVHNNPKSGTEDYWIAYEHPQVVVQFYNALSGDLLYAESIVAGL